MSKTTTYTIGQTRIDKGYLNGDIRHGRTTLLLVKTTGKVLGEWVGINTRRVCHREYLAAQARGVHCHAGRRIPGQ